MPTERDVAEWMLAQLRHGQWLYQETVVGDIESRFGEEFTYINDNGNPAISREVLKAFRSISAKEVVWERSERAWRLRTKHDAPSRQQE